MLTEANNLIKSLQKREAEREERMNGVEGELELNKMLLRK